jgi:hypothetical protein
VMSGKSNPVSSLFQFSEYLCSTINLNRPFYFVICTSHLGQILISKSGNNGLNLAALHVAAHMQLEHQFYFRLSEGDKDTFVRAGFFCFFQLLILTARILIFLSHHHKRSGTRFGSSGPHTVSRRAGSAVLDSMRHGMMIASVVLLCYR